MDIIYWVIIIAATIVSICVVFWIYEIRQNSKQQLELLESQVKLLASIAEKAGVPLRDVNEAIRDKQSSKTLWG